MSDPCRDAFEKWSLSLSPVWGDKLFQRRGEDYIVLQTHCDWKAWQAAWNTRADTLPSYEDIHSLFQQADKHYWTSEMLFTAILARIKGETK